MIEIKTDNLKELEKIEKARMTFEALRQQYPAILQSDQVAQLLGTQESTIRQWTRKNKIPHQKLGGFVRYLLSDIAFWLAGGNSTPGTPELTKLQQTETPQKRKRGRPRKEEVLKRQGLI